MKLNKRHTSLVSGLRVQIVHTSSGGDPQTAGHGTLTGLATCRSTAVEAGCVLIPGYGTGIHSS